MSLIRPYADAEPALRAGPLAGAAGNLTAKRRPHAARLADQLTKLADLRDRGVISAGEFERQKAKVLAA